MVIGSFEAKTHFSELIEDVQKGASITITKRGKPVAVLTPYEEKSLKRSDIIDSFKDIRLHSSTDSASIAEMIREGRKA